MSGSVNPVFRPDFTDNTAPQNRLAPWSNFGADETPLESDYWLQQARLLAANPEDYGKVEPLPGITSGAPRYGQNTSQLNWQAAQPPPAPSSQWAAGIALTRPGDSTVDRRALLPGLGSSASPVFKIWRGGNVLLPSQDTRRDLGELPPRPSSSPAFPSPRTQISQ